MKKRIVVISDIHGCLNEFKLLLKRAAYDPNEDRLLILGDLEDRGLNSKQVIETLIEMQKNEDVIIIKGNHDWMAHTCLASDEFTEDDELWISNGGFMTIVSYVGNDWFETGYNHELYMKAKSFIRQHYASHIEFLQSLPLYHQEENHLFVHAGINPFAGGLEDQKEDDFLWVRDLFLKAPTCLDETVVFGHTPCVYLHDCGDVWFGDGKIGIDGGCCFGVQLNALEIRDGSYETFSVRRGETDDPEMKIYWPKRTASMGGKID